MHELGWKKRWIFFLVHLNLLVGLLSWEIKKCPDIRVGCCFSKDINKLLLVFCWKFFCWSKWQKNKLCRSLLLAFNFIWIKLIIILLNDIFESMKSKIYKVMEDIWKTKDKLSSDYNNNLKSYLKDARKKQSESGKLLFRLVITI